MTTTKTEEKKELGRQVICDIQKSETEIVRVSTGEYKGTTYVDLRLFFRGRDNGEYRPTKKGLTLTSELFTELVKGLKRAEQAFKARK